MVQNLVVVILALFHILSTIGWMGTAMFVVMVMTPTMLKLSPPSRLELIMGLFPRLIRYVAIFATLTIVFGALLAFATVGGSMAAFALSNPWGFRISIGAGLTLLAFVVAVGVVVPTLRKIMHMAEGIRQNPKDKRPAEMATLQKKLKLSSMTVLALLTVILVFMVAAARF